MNTKSIAASNRFLKQRSAVEKMAVNLASSTAIETGKGAGVYVKRYRSTHLEQVTEENLSVFQKRSVS